MLQNIFNTWIQPFPFRLWGKRTKTEESSVSWLLAQEVQRMNIVKQEFVQRTRWLFISTYIIFFSLSCRKFSAVQNFIRQMRACIIAMLGSMYDYCVGGEREQSAAELWHRKGCSLHISHASLWPPLVTFNGHFVLWWECLIQHATVKEALAVSFPVVPLGIHYDVQA